MDKTEQEDLEKAYKEEKTPRWLTRMLAVHMARVRKKYIGEIAADLMRSAR